MKKTENDRFLEFQNKLTDIRDTLSDINEPYIEKYDPKISSLKESLIKVFENKVHNNKEETGILTGLSKINSCIKGLEKGSLTVIGTHNPHFSLPLTMVSNLLNEEKKDLKFGFISAKLNEEELISRLMAIYTKTPLREFKNLSLNEVDFKQIKSACEKLYNKSIYINENLFPTLDEFLATVCKMKYMNEIDILFEESFDSVGCDLNDEFKS